MIASVELPPGIVVAFSIAGIPVLAWLVRRDRAAGAPPDPFPPVDGVGLLSLFVALFLGQGVAAIPMVRGGPLGFAAAALCLAGALAVWRFGISRSVRPLGKPRDHVTAGLLTAWAVLPLAYGTALLLGLFGVVSKQAAVEVFERRGPGWQTLALFAVAVAPVTEELAFRGALLPALRRLGNPRSARLLSALAFGAVHYESPVAAVAMVIFGLFLARLLERTGAILACVVAHMAFNGLTVGALIF